MKKCFTRKKTCGRNKNNNTFNLSLSYIIRLFFLPNEEKKRVEPNTLIIMIIIRYLDTKHTTEPFWQNKEHKKQSISECLAVCLLLWVGTVYFVDTLIQKQYLVFSLHRPFFWIEQCKDIMKILCVSVWLKIVYGCSVE